MNLDELEAQAIASRFDPAQLSVYADALQSSRNTIDQLRGELIALDLNVPTPDSDQRRREVLGSWLGELAPHVRCRWGFLHLSDDVTVPDQHVLAKLLSSPNGAWLRGLELYGDSDFLLDRLALVGSSERRRLAGLALVELPERGNSPRRTIRGPIVNKLIAATSALSSLAVRGSEVLGAFAHPTVHRIRAAGWNAIGALAGEGGPLLALAELDLAFHRDFMMYRFGRPDRQHRERMLRGVPALRRLDLSRNEMVDDPYEQPADVFEFIRELAIKKRLTHLRVPAIRTPEHLATLQYSLDRMPDLVELDVARLAPRNLLPGDERPRGPRRTALGSPPPPFVVELFHGGTIRLPGPSQWVPRTHQRGRDTIAITVPSHPHRIAVDLVDAVTHLESTWASLRQPSRDAWNLWWAMIDALAWDPNPVPNYNPPPGMPTPGTPVRRPFSAAALATCCAPMTEPRWRALHAAITARPLPADATVQVRRLWSYD